MDVLVACPGMPKKYSRGGLVARNNPIRIPFLSLQARMSYHSPLPDSFPRYLFYMTRLAFVLLLAFSTFAAQAATIVPSPPQVAAKAYFLVDARSGAVLAEHNADIPEELVSQNFS